MAGGALLIPNSQCSRYPGICFGPADLRKEKRMKVQELIQVLKEMPQNAEVAVKYRDDGGCYPGCDFNIVPNVNEWDRTVDKGVVLL